MATVYVRRKVRRWGNGWGIRLNRADVERLGVKAGDEIEAEIFGRRDARDLERLAIFNFGGGYDIDELVADELIEELGGDR